MPDYRLFQLSNSQEIPRFMGSAVPELTAAAQALQQRYDTSLHYQDMLDQGIQQSTATSADTQMLQDLKTKYRDRLRDFAKRGDYENMVRESHRAARDFANEYKPLADNVQLQSAYKKELDEKVSKGDIDPLTAERLWDYSIRSYKGLQRDPRTGQMTNQFRGMASVKNINLPEWVDKALVGITDTKTGSTIRKDVNGYYVESGSTREYLKWDRIKPVLDAAKASDPNFQAWASQQALINSYQADHIPDEAIMTSSLYPELKAEAEKRGVKPQQVLKEMYANRALQNIDQSITAFGSKYLKDNYESTYKVMGETEETKRVRDKAFEDKNNPVFSVPLQYNLPGTSLSTPGQLQDSRATSLESRNALRTKVQDLYNTRGVVKGTNGQYWDKDGKNVTEEVRRFQHMDDQLTAQMEQLAERDRRLREKSGFVVDEKVEKEANKAYNRILETGGASSVVMGDTESPGTSKAVPYSELSPEAQKVRRKEASDAYDAVVKRAKPDQYAQYKKLLEEDSKNSSMTVGVRRFNKEGANKAMEDLIANLSQDLDPKGLKAGALGMLDMQGNALNAEDYQVMRGDTKFAGWFIDPQGRYKIAMKVGKVAYDKDGKPQGEAKLVQMDAPPEMMQYLIRTGQDDVAEQFTNQRLGDMEMNNELKETRIPLDDNNNSVRVRRAQNTEMDGITSQFVLEYNLDGKIYTVPVDRKDAAVESISQTIKNLNKPTKK